MKPNTIQSVLQAALENEIHPDQIRLWPAVEQHLVARQHPQRRQRGVFMETGPARVFRMRQALLAILVLVSVAVLLIATPQGRSFAQSVWLFFARASGDTIPAYPTQALAWVNVTPGLPPASPTPRAVFGECGDYDTPKCSVEQIRAKVNFKVEELGTIPVGMHFIGATGGPERIVILYANGVFAWALDITEEPWSGGSTSMKWPVGASAVVETVKIGSARGEYVKGDFVPAPDGSSQTWDANAGAQTLQWVQDDVFFSMRQIGPAAILDEDALVALAESLTSEPVSARLTPAAPTETPLSVVTFQGVRYDQSVSQVQAQVGFDILEPGRLPTILSFAGAAVDPDERVARIFYLQQNPGLADTFGLKLSEQLVFPGKDCRLCGLVVGDYGAFLAQKNTMVVGANAVVETVQVGEATGKYVQGYWGLSNPGWAWLPLPFVQTLRWQAAGKAFELQYASYSNNGGVPLGKNDLIAIAAGLK